MFSKPIHYIPVDFIKAEIIGLKRTELENNSLLDFISAVNRKTGEVYDYQEARYKNMKIEIYPSNRIILSGSLHILANDGEHNYNDFTHTMFVSVLSELKNKIAVEAFHLRIIHLEWGVNIVPPILTGLIIDRSLIHKKKAKTVNIDDPKEGKYIQFKHNNYVLKMYDKGLQHQLGFQLLRIEMKQTNWSNYRREGIVTLHDFIRADKRDFMNTLISHWNAIIYYGLKSSYNGRYIKYVNPIYWNDLFQNKSRTAIKKQVDHLKKLNKSIGDNMQCKIGDLICEKVNELQLNI